MTRRHSRSSPHSRTRALLADAALPQSPRLMQTPPCPSAPHIQIGAAA